MTAAQRATCHTQLHILPLSSSACRVALDQALITCQGRTPEATMASALYTDVKRKLDRSLFTRCSMAHCTLAAAPAAAELLVQHWTVAHASSLLRCIHACVQHMHAGRGTAMLSAMLQHCRSS